MATSTVSYDVIVVGAGIEGSSAAYHLVKHGQETLLLEQSRITRYAYPEDYYTHMMLDAFPMWDTLQTEARVNFFKQCGVINLGPTNGQFLRSVSTAMSRHGMEYHVIHPADLRVQYPMLQYPINYGAVLDPKGGILRADRALAAVQSVFKMKGGVLRDGEQVKDIVPGEPWVTVTTSKGSYRAKKIVIATGPWTAKLLQPLGLRLPLRPVRITVCYWRENREGALSAERFPCLLDDGGEDAGGGFHVYGLPSEEYPGYVKVCLHTGPDIDPDQRDSADDTWVRERITKYVRRHLPWLHGDPGIVESCIYTNTPDANPVIDTHPRWKNIVIAAGFS
ncbi:hypothetical protein BaRGS_00033525, partial [Batillaria attramentaria]